MKHQNYVLVDSNKTLYKLIEICKIYNVKFTDQDHYPTYRMFGRRLSGGYWLSSEYTGIPITIAEFVAHLESEEKPASILDGKCAIQVNNEREFKLLMEHYESKGWKWSNGDKPLETRSKSQVELYGFKTNIEYKDNTKFNLSDISNDIPFSDFAKEVGITVPVFIMKSEDGVDLYEGDIVVTAHIKGRIIANSAWVANINVNKHEKENYLFFSSLTAAEKWIEEQNNPKEIEIEIHSKGSVLITSDMVRINGVVTKFTPREIESIYKAFQSLQ